MNTIGLVFFGTSDFAVPILERLAADGRFEVRAVVTQPDRPVGRKAVLTEPPAKIAAKQLGLTVLQFEQVKSDEAYEALKAVPMDAAAVASFGQIIPQRVLDLAPKGFINVHASILPAYRGASPIAAAIKNGDSETGVTIMLMDALMDHGPALSVAKEPVNAEDTAMTLSARLSRLGADLLPDTIVGYIEGMIKPQEQEHEKATKVKLLTREDGLIDWTQTADAIERMIRAYDPWPGAYTMVDGKRLKILKARLGQAATEQPGSFYKTNDGQPAVACGNGTSLVLDQVQPEGKPAMSGRAYANGRR